MKTTMFSLLVILLVAGCISNDGRSHRFRLIWRETSGIPIEKVPTPRGFKVSPETAVKGIMGLYSRLPNAEFYLFVDAANYYFGNTRKGTELTAPQPGHHVIDGITGKITAPKPDVDGLWRLPLLREVTKIIVWTPSNWHLVVRPDGSADVFGTAAVADGAFVPLKTFAFSKLYDSLSRSVRRDGDRQQMVVVTFFTDGKQSSYVHSFTDDIAFIGSLFDTAKTHCTPEDKERFEKVWSERPPVLKN